MHLDRILTLYPPAILPLHRSESPVSLAKLQLRHQKSQTWTHTSTFIETVVVDQGGMQE